MFCGISVLQKLERINATVSAVVCVVLVVRVFGELYQRVDLSLALFGSLRWPGVNIALFLRHHAGIVPLAPVYRVTRRNE